MSSVLPVARDKVISGPDYVKIDQDARKALQNDGPRKRYVESDIAPAMQLGETLQKHRFRDAEHVSQPRTDGPRATFEKAPGNKAVKYRASTGFHGTWWASIRNNDLSISFMLQARAMGIWKRRMRGDEIRMMFCSSVANQRRRL
ncbi:hypothetical protein HBI51_161470 [Parastagonospora nodorum]|nr:hypothetical protein HBI51_161470 [Parastagonospora nodorum]